MVEFLIHVSSFLFTYKNSLLHFSLKDVFDSLSHKKGILPFRIENLFAIKFSPTFVLFVFSSMNLVCLEVKI